MSSLFRRLAVEVLVVGLRIGACGVDDAVAMIRRGVQRVQPQWNRAGIDDGGLRPGRDEHREARPDGGVGLSRISVGRLYRR